MWAEWILHGLLEHVSSRDDVNIRICIDLTCAPRTMCQHGSKSLLEQRAPSFYKVGLTVKRYVQDSLFVTIVSNQSKRNLIMLEIVYNVDVITLLEITFHISVFPMMIHDVLPVHKHILTVIVMYAYLAPHMLLIHLQSLVEDNYRRLSAALFSSGCWLPIGPCFMRVLHSWSIALQGTPWSQRGHIPALSAHTSAATPKER